MELEIELHIYSPKGLGLILNVSEKNLANLSLDSHPDCHS
jgi:hypothetical protein